jgi:hypothetical protein
LNKVHKIVNIRGTSGSGKTTVVNRVMELLREREKVEKDTLLWLEMGGKQRVVGHRIGPVFVAGRYSTTCGGCDTMSWKGAADDVCALVLAQAAQGPVVFEGLMVSGWGTGRLKDLWEAAGRNLHVIQLTTPLEDCLASVQARRAARAAAKGEEAKPLNPENTTAKWHGTRRGSELLVKAGVPVEFLDREAAFHRAKELVS